MNRAVEYLTRNPAFLRKLREAVFPYPEDPTKKWFRFEARRAVETEYHIELPANAEFDSFEECVELIRQQNAFSPAVVPQISPRLSPVRKEAPEELFSECPPAAPRIYWEYSSHPYVEDGRFVALRVDLTRTKEEVLRDFGRCYDELVGDVEKPKTKKIPPRTIDDLKVWDEYIVERRFSAIAKKHGSEVSAVRKGYYRAFQRIMGEPYDPLTHRRSALTKEQLECSCDRCAQNPDRGGTCDALCPSALAFVNQDLRASGSVAADAETVAAPLQDSPDAGLRESDLLNTILRATGKQFDSIDDALTRMTEEDKQRLVGDPEIAGLRRRGR